MTAGARERIYVGVDGLILEAGANYYLCNCNDVVLGGDASVAWLKDSTVRDMWGSSTVRDMWGSSTVQDMRDSSTVRNMRGSSTAKASPLYCGSAGETITVCENATFIDNGANPPKVYRSGECELVITKRP